MENQRSDGRIERESDSELYRLLAESVKDYAIFVVDREGRVQSWPRGAERLLGYREEEILGQPFEVLFTPEDRQAGIPSAELASAEATGRGEDDRWHVRRDGSRFWASGIVTPLRDPSGELRGFAKIMRDRTDWKQIEQAHRESEASRAAVLETALDAIITIDQDDRIVEFNPAAERLFGYRRDDVVGQKMGELIVPPELRSRHAGGLKNYLATGEGPILGRRLEMSACRADGTVFPAELAVIRNPTDQPILFTGYIRDISERKNRERRTATQLAVTQVLAEAATVHEAAPCILQKVCEGLSWDVGGVWIVDRPTQTLRCLAVWQMPAVDVAEFAAASREQSLAKGVGLPGRVWERGEPLWMSDVTDTRNFPRLTLAANVGLRSAFAIPLRLGEQVLGVVEFLSQSIKEPDADLLGMMATVGGQFGQFIERKYTEDALRESESRFRGMMEQAPFSIQVFSRDGQTLRVNRAWEELWGIPQEVIGDYNILDDPQLEEKGVLGEIRRAFEGEVVEVPAVHYDLDQTVPDRTRHSEPRRWVTAVAYPLRDSDGQVREVILVHEDISERKRTEQDLRFLADASRSLATLVDPESTLQQIAGLAVPHFADWCAVYLPEETDRLRQLAVAHVDPSKVQLAIDARARWPLDPSLPGGAEHVFRTGKSVLIEEMTPALLRDAAQDEEHFALLRALGLHSYICVPLVVRDRTLGVITFVTAESRRRYSSADLSVAEDLARRAAIASDNASLYATLREEARKKDEFLAMLAHELRNPLAPIRSGLDLLGMTTTEREVLDMMQQQVEHLVRLVDDLLDVSRIMRGKVELRREPTQLGTVVSRVLDTVQPLVARNRQHLSKSLPREPIWMDADPIRLAQVIGNLLNNASKYTEQGGEIHLSVEPHEDHVVIRIRDTGAGISTDVLPHVFDLFTQDQRTIDRSQGGLGIGLTVAKNLVEMHGGKVTASSEGPGYGSEFVVRLPTIPSPRVSSDSDSRVAASPPLRILVVDDNVAAAKMLELLLTRLGDHRVAMAHDGLAAIRTAQEQRPDLILLDIGLPKLDGFEVARRLRQDAAFHRTYMVAVTGYGTAEDRRKSLEAGFDEHLVKPPHVESLRTILTHANPHRREK